MYVRNNTGSVTRNIVHAYTMCSSVITVIPLGVTLGLYILQEGKVPTGSYYKSISGFAHNIHLVYTYIFYKGRILL